MEVSTNLYGQIVATFVKQDFTQTINLHEYTIIDDILGTNPRLHMQTINNQYVDVVELVQTKRIVHVLPSIIVDIIFIFKKDEIVGGSFPCAGIDNILVI